MTSGTFTSVPIAFIRVNREGRQRAEPSLIDELAESIQRIGLINPILIDHEYNLIAGERRLLACRSLNWTNIPIQYQDEVAQEVLIALELEENVKRVELDWRDQVRGVRAYHDYMCSVHGRENWPQWRTADGLGLSTSLISKMLGVADELALGHTKIAQAPTMSAAVGIMERVRERRAADAKVHLHSTMAPSLRRDLPDEPVPEAPVSPIMQANFNTWAADYSGPRFNLIHCDFPYGIGAHKTQLSTAGLRLGTYEDTPEVYWQLCETLARYLDQLAAESCHLVFWFSLLHYQSTKNFFEARTDFEIDPFPFVWHKSDAAGIIPDPQRGPRRTYETAFFGSRGDRKIISPVAASYAAPTVRSTHMSEKPEPMLSHFFRMLVDGNTRLLDPTCGSGSALRAATRLGAGFVQGLELDADRALDAQHEYAKMQTLKELADAK